MTQRTAPLSMSQVLLCGAAIVTLSMGIRHGFGLWLQPITQTQGWSRENFAFAIAIQNLAWGLAGIFAGMVADKFGQSSAGSPAQDRDCGPLINAAQKERVEGFIQRAKQAGVPVLAQGRVAEGVPSGGYYVAPTMFGPVPREHELACDEVFGPVLAVIPFDTEADAISLANATDFGLLAGIWTRDGGRQIRMAKQMQCGQVYINCYGAGGGVELPFGGVKRSGHGREKGFLALEEFCNVKTVVQYHGE